MSIYNDKYNVFWLKHFLIVNKIAKGVCLAMGWNVDNFAKTIIEERQGVWANSQMTTIFWVIEKEFAEAHYSDAGVLFEELEDENGISIEEIAQWTDSELNELYQTIVPTIIF